MKSWGGTRARKLGWAHLPEHDDTPADVKAHINRIYANVGLDDRKL
jgi:hypothetical protein